jgi:hypothetical protein
MTSENKLMASLIFPSSSVAVKMRVFTRQTKTQVVVAGSKEEEFGMQFRITVGFKQL